jgi:uncharacterized protein (TIGR03435 family)
MNSRVMRLAVQCVRGWTWLYTCRMPPGLRDTRRAEIESDLWESRRDATEDSLGSALQILLRLLIGIPDDLGWCVEQAAAADRLTRQRIALSARVAGAALFLCALWVIDADASRRRPAMAVGSHAAGPGQEIDGPMSMRAGTPLLTAGIAATVGASMLAQRAAQSPPIAAPGDAFEVASIKPNPAGFAGPTQTQLHPGGRFVATNIPVVLLIGQAFQVQGYRLVGGPHWLATDGFDIDAKADGELFPKGGQRPLEGPLRALLADRFKLVVHSETRPWPIYALVVARSDGRLGPNLTRSSRTDCDAVQAAAQGRGGGPLPPPAGGQAPPCGGMTGNGRFAVDSRTPAELAGMLSATLNARVVDRTGLTGLFNAHLTWTPDRMPQQPDPDRPAIDPNGPSIFTAVQEQLGLKLESTTGPVEVLVIDRVERPTPD